MFGEPVAVTLLLRPTLPRIGLVGGDEASDLDGVSTQAASDWSGERSSSTELLSEPSTYFGLLFSVLLLRRTFEVAAWLSFFLVGVVLG
jgi:hypothetical protein